MENKKMRNRVMADVTNYLSYSDAQKIINATDNLRDRLLFTWLFMSGRRISEIVRKVKLKDINFDEKLITYSILKRKKDEIRSR